MRDIFNPRQACYRCRRRGRRVRRPTSDINSTNSSNYAIVTQDLNSMSLPLKKIWPHTTAVGWGRCGVPHAPNLVGFRRRKCVRGGVTDASHDGKGGHRLNRRPHDWCTREDGYRTVRAPRVLDRAHWHRWALRAQPHTAVVRAYRVHCAQRPLRRLRDRYVWTFTRHCIHEFILNSC